MTRKKVFTDEENKIKKNERSRRYSYYVYSKKKPFIC